MDVNVKSVLLATAICAAGFKSIGTLFDSFISPDSQETLAAQRDRQTDSQDQQQIDALLKGADPSEIFEPTAAGGQHVISECASGELELAEGLKPEMDGHTYVSVRLNQHTYIRVIPFDHTYLVQQPYQSVSASEQAKIPDDAMQQLNQVLTDAGRCEQRTLYLSSVK